MYYSLQEPDGFGLPESSAILRHLCNSRPDIPDHWYPKSNERTRATIDAIMAWHGSTLRIGSMIVVWNLAISANLGMKGNKQLVDDYGLPTLKEALRVLDSVWLGRNNNGKFLVGNEISTADILLACEVEQLCMLDGIEGAPTMAKLLAPCNKVSIWLENVRSAGQPHYDDVHKMIRSARDRQLSKKNSNSKM
jgi:glutathione S-transferase